jgi:hypothetical protein
MVMIPLGLEAYKRQYAGEPEIVLQNRYVEKNPSNLVEKATLIARAGSNSLEQLAGGTIRGNFSKLGTFNSDLFTTSGHNFWRTNSLTGIAAQITGTINGDGFPYVTWMKGIGYEFLFISDGTSLQYYSTHAVGTLTLSGGSITDFSGGGQVIDINGVYFAWSANVNAGTPAGTSGSPYLAKLGSAVPDGFGLTDDVSSLSNMVLLLNFAGVSGSDYSNTVPGPNASVTAVGPKYAFDPTTLTVTSIVDGTAGNAITTTIFSGAHLAWTAGTLGGGGGTALQTVTGMGAGEVPKALATISGYVLVSVYNSQKCYFINPGETVIDPLNFFEKESAPDVILDMLAINDMVLIMGNGSTENWYATGNFEAPFAPIEGRVYQRGVIEGTPTIVGDAACIVGQDGIVYLIGYAFGGVGQYGVHRISTNSIEERIRVQLRMEQGLAP